MVSDEYVLAIPQGTLDKLEPDILKEYKAYEIQAPCYSLMNEVAKLPWDTKVILPVIPGISHIDENKDWKTAIGDCVTALKVSAISNDRLNYLRLHNAFDTFERFLHGYPASRLPKGPCDTAFVVGLGGSLRRFVEEFGTGPTHHGATFVAWSASNAFKYVSFLGHCDPRDPKDSNKSFSHDACEPSGIISSPGACTSFLTSYSKKPLFSFLSEDSPIDAWFCEKLKAKAMPSINGTVTHMLTKAAVMAGYKKIVLVGCELSYASRAAGERANDGKACEKFKNAKGETVYSPHKYAICRHGFNSIAEEHPDVEFFNYSEDGIQFKDVPLWNRET